MRIEWRGSVPAQDLLPRHHPAAGLIAADPGLRAAGTFCFSDAVEPLPPPHPAAPGVLDALDALHDELGATPQTSANLRLLREGAQAVVTGQQAGLLGGPLFTLLKTLTAIRVARALTARHGRPFVPVFWSETEDHDADEVNQAWTIGADARPARFCLPWPEAHRGAPVGRLPLGEEAKDLVRAFFEAGAPTEFTPGLRDALLADVEGADYGRWFARHLMRLFGRHGLVVADSLDPRLAAAGRPLWARVLERPLRLTEICQEEGRRLAEGGWRPILAKMERRTPFFLIEDGARVPVTYERGLFRTPRADHTALALLRRLEERPGDFSPAVHLRPQLQDFLLPTAVYVAGPTELAYFLQVLPGYGALEVPPPALVLRASLTLVEPTVAKTLARYALAPEDLARGTDHVLGALVRREQKFASPTLWERTREQAQRPLAKLAEGMQGEHPDLAARVEQTRGKVEFLVKELEAKTLAELRKKAETAREQLERARARLYPNGEPQERVLSAYHFLNKYGPGLVDDLLEQLPEDFSRHHFGTLLP